MKIGPLSIILIGVAIGVISLSFALFQHYIPNTKETEMWDNYQQALRTEVGNWDKAVKRVHDAEALAEAKAVEWRQIVAVRTPTTNLEDGGIDLTVQGMQLALNVPTYRNSLQKALNQQLRAGGVRVVQGPRIPDPPQDPNVILQNYFNYPVYPYPVVVLDLGQVTVRGTYQQIKANINAWTTMPRYLAVADRLAISGTSPKLTGTYNLSIVGFMRIPPGKTLFPPVPVNGVQFAGVPPPPAPGTNPAPGTPGQGQPGQGQPGQNKPNQGQPGGGGNAPIVKG